jgi:DnaK suppressor protein
MDDTRIDEVRTFLEGERSRLLAEIAEFETEQESFSEASGENNYRDHMADQGTATFIRDVDAALEDNVREVLASVERALERIDDGTYGKCRRCGEAIPEQRLEAMPTAELCIACKEWEEGR